MPDRPALLVDLDGTFVDTFPDLVAAAVRTLHARGVEPVLAPGDPRVRQATGAGAGAVLRALSGIGEVPAAWVADMVDDYETRICELGGAFDGVEAWLDFPLAVVTNKPLRLAVRLLGRVFARPPLVCTPETAGVAKPDPAMLAEACRHLGVAPAAAWVIGDDPRDEAAAVAAGMRFWAADWGYAPPGTWSGRAADGVLRHPAELLDRIRADRR